MRASVESLIPYSRKLPVAALVAVVAVLSVATILAGNGELGIALIPVVVASLVAAVWYMPLRYTLPALAFLCLTLENPSEFPASGLWKSPLFGVGALFLNHMNTVLPVKALIFSGLDVTLVLFGVVILYRRAKQSTVDSAFFVPAARPLERAALACIGTILAVWAFGLVRGGDFGNSLWQVFRVIYLPCVLLLFLAGLAGPIDMARLGRVLIFAALLRSAIAIYVRYLFPDFDEMPFTTVHADSMLFSNAFLFIATMLLERPTTRRVILALPLLSVFAWAMIANTRRLAWVELGTALLVIYLIARWNPVKRRIAQTIVMATPLLLAYVITGWAHPTGIFAPVQTIRSVVDSNADTSTAWRDMENFDLYYTQRTYPLVGTGFGHEYIEYVTLPAIDTGEHGYKLYRYAPHNSVLGLLTYGGVVGFAGIWMLIPLGVFFAVRTYRRATESPERIAALTSIGILITYAIHCYGDMGLGTFTSVFTVAPAIALIGKLAVVTGAWPGAEAAREAAVRVRARVLSPDPRAIVR